MFRFVVAQAAAGSRMVFNYAAFRIDLRSLPTRLQSLGSALVDIWSAADLYRRFYGREPPGDVRSAADAFFISLATR